MVVFIGAAGAAVIAALQWGISAMTLVIELLTLISVGVGLVMIIRDKSGGYGITELN
jgi:hypothetical protein